MPNEAPPMPEVTRDVPKFEPSPATYVSPSITVERICVACGGQRPCDKFSGFCRDCWRIAVLAVWAANLAGPAPASTPVVPREPAAPLTCAKCGAERHGVTSETFVCRRCLSMDSSGVVNPYEKPPRPLEPSEDAPPTPVPGPGSEAGMLPGQQPRFRHRVGYACDRPCFYCTAKAGEACRDEPDKRVQPDPGSGPTKCGTCGDPLPPRGNLNYVIDESTNDGRGGFKMKPCPECRAPNPGSGMGPADGKFHGFKVESDGHTIRSYVDGELMTEETVAPPPASPCAECGGSGLEMVDGEPVGPCRECRIGGGRRTPPTPERKP